MKMITDVNGLKTWLRSIPQHNTPSVIADAIDAFVIDAPDLVRREDVVDKNNQYYIGDERIDYNNEIDAIPAWDGKE